MKYMVFLMNSTFYLFNNSTPHFMSRFSDGTEGDISLLTYSIMLTEALSILQLQHYKFGTYVGHLGTFGKAVRWIPIPKSGPFWLNLDPFLDPDPQIQVILCFQ